MKRVNFRISETTYEQLKQLAEKRGESMNAAVQYAVQSAVQSAVQKGHDAVQENPEKSASEIEWKELYFAEKNRNDELSDRLLDLSGKVTDAFRAEKVTDAFDAGAKILESTQQKEEQTKKPWWQFWK